MPISQRIADEGGGGFNPIKAEPNDKKLCDQSDCTCDQIDKKP